MADNNLDYLCAKHGQNIPKANRDEETMIQKALGVLQEEGLFAFVVFLESKKGSTNKEVVGSILGKTAELLNEVGLTKDANDKNIREMILDITKDIDSMFLAKDLIERMLIYARYRAKALQK